MKKRSTPKSTARSTGYKRKIKKEKLPVQPSSGKPSQSDWFGSMRGTFEILGDIISPASDEDEWEVLRD